MKEILIINLGRYGDLIQTTPLLRVLKETYPSARVTLVAQKRFGAILPLISRYDRCILLDQDGLTRTLATSEGIPAAYGALEQFLGSMEGVRYDLVLNLTSSDFSAHLVALMDAAVVAGKTSDRDGRTLAMGEWGLYLYSFLRGDSRRYNRINLTDIFCNMAGLVPHGRPVELHETEEGRRSASTLLNRVGKIDLPLVALQLGASDPGRCWPAASFARLSDLLQETAGVRTVLLGSPGERTLADQARALMKHDPVDAVGSTDIQGLFSTLRRCTLLVSNDTGTLHFAAAGGIPTVMLAVGPASFFCTGPSSAGNLALRPPLPCFPCRYDLPCGNPVCRDSITVESVYNACRLLLGTPLPEGDGYGIGLYRSDFAPDGYLQWQPLCHGNHDGEKLTRRYARLWKKVLGSGFKVQGSRFEVRGSEFKVQGSRFSHGDAPEPLFPELLRLTTEGRRVTQEIMTAAKLTPLPLSRISALGEEEAGLESDIRCLAVTNPDLSPLVDFMTILKENIAATDLHAIAATTHDIYARISHLVALL